ncbi:hypothetical protein THIOSC15_2110006 [uncultured Thiomicrorhabdus sp.]
MSAARSADAGQEFLVVRGADSGRTGIAHATATEITKVNIKRNIWILNFWKS